MSSTFQFAMPYIERQRMVQVEFLDKLLIAEACQQVLELSDDDFDNYDNPFELKATLRDKYPDPPLGTVISHLEHEGLVMSEHLFGHELRMDRGRHYCSVFRYPPGARLGVHVDAGIHPKTQQRKHVTAVAYLNDVEGYGGALEFWRGENCAEANPKVHQSIRAVIPRAGQVVFFENNDYGWHGMSQYWGPSPRVVVTVSYLSEAVDAFANRRTRAFFVPHPDGPEWTEETYDMRDRRAGEATAKEVYRAGG